MSHHHHRLPRKSRQSRQSRTARYSRADLALYDPIVFGLVNPLVWQCPAARLRRLYQENATSTHLDVGVGTGYFLDRVAWAHDKPSITLLDLNETALATAGKRLARYRPHAVLGDVTRPLADLPGTPFASVGVNYVLHCLPGSLPDKAATLFANLSAVLADGGVVFGSTILAAGSDSPRRARTLMRFFNRHDVLHNEADTAEGLQRALAGSFADYQVDTVGSIALFAARTSSPERP
jgi:hypothetical protein